nr:MAG: integrase SAM-like domain [Bacteriophage sp.]
MYEASEYTPDYSARERALQLLADVKKREEGSKVVRLDKRTLVVRNEKRMDEDLRKKTEKKPRKKTVVVTTNRHKPSVCAEQDMKKPNRTKAKPIRAKISMEAIMQKTGTIQRKRVGITFIDFCAAEIAELRRMGENTTAERYEKILRINRDLFEGIDIGLLDYTHILAAQEAMSHRGLSANSIGMYNRNLRTMYNRAVARGIVEDASP